MTLLSKTIVCHQALKTVMDGLPPPSKRSAHQTLQGKVALAAAHQTLNTLLADIVPLAPAHWPNAWSWKLLQSGKSWRLSHKSLAFRIEAPFDPVGLAEGLGVLLGLLDRASLPDPVALPTNAAQTNAYLTFQTNYGNKPSLYCGHTLHEALALQSLRTQKAIVPYTSFGYSKPKAPVETLMETRERWGKSPLSKDAIVSTLPMLWAAVMDHKVLRNSVTKTGRHATFTQALGVADPSFLVGPTMPFSFYKKRGISDTFDATSLDTLTACLTTLLAVLDQTKPRRGTTGSWVVLSGDTWSKVEAWDGRSALLVAAFEDLLAGRLPDIHDRTALPCDQSFHGASLALVD